MNKYLILVVFIALFSQIQAQEPNDCVNAITVCGNGVFSSGATGIGNTQEVSGCGGFEHNSIWLEINIVQSGTLGFDLIPNDPDILVDYDFWVYGPDRLCSNLGSPIRCSTTNPNAAGLANNHTGINGSTTLTQTGPGPNGNGYVYWLTVTAGQTYYIIIDRPVGDGGFQLEWTGTAMNGSGAFPAPPSANSIDDVIACSSTPDVSIFDLNGLSGSISNNLANETVEYYTSLADATDGMNSLPGIYANTSNPQLIYAKVSSNITDCYSLVEFNLVVSEIPDATVTVSPTTICEGESVTYTFSGTPNATIHYTLDGNTTTSDLLLDDTGTAVINLNPTTNTTLDLIDAQILSNSNTVVCSKPLNESLTVTVNPNVTPAFTQIDSICNGETIGALPTTSNNGITGTWSPAINNTSTTTYTFTPDIGQCATTQTMEIIVNPTLTPTFTQVNPVCSGESLSPLPTTSNNGVTGTWSPAINNTSTTTYTFTPDIGQCATTQTMEIVVTPLTTPIFTQVNPICSGESLSPLPTTSNNGVNGTWSPAINNTATTTYTFTPDIGQCASEQSMEIVVNTPTAPIFTQVNPICSGEALPPLPTTSNNGVNGTWSPAINNTATATYTFTPDIGQCATTQTMEIIVNPLPVITNPTPLSVCDIDIIDGITEIDLTVKDYEITSGNTNYVVTYYNSIDAAIAGTPEVSPSSNAYIGTDGEVVYVRVEDNNTGCFNTTSLLLNVVDAPQSYPFTNPITFCDDDNDGFGYFDLNSVVEDMTGSTSGVDVTFYETLLLAEQGLDPIDTSVLYQNIDTGNPGHQTVYAVLSLNGLECNTFVEVNLEVLDSPELPDSDFVYALCEDDGSTDGYVAFDLLGYAHNQLGIDPTLDINFFEGLDASNTPI
ncbi:MAG: hypothetical protein ACPG45_03005, partial [Flavobacteriaceae bacterium]